MQGEEAENPGALPSRPAPRSRRLTLVAGIVLVVVGVVLVVRRLQNALLVSTDLAQDYAAAMVLRTGQGSIYQHFTEASLRQFLSGSERLAHIQPELTNYHPPFNALFFVPLTYLPYDVVALLWGIVSILLYVGIGALVLRELSIHLPTNWLVLLVGLALCWYPFQSHLALGQLSLPLAACVFGCWWLLRRQRDGLAGVLLGVACLIKLFPGLLFVYLLLRRRWWALVSGAACMGVVGVLTLALVGQEDIVYYITHITPHDAERFGAVVGNISLIAAIRRLFIGSPLARPLIHAPELAVVLIVLSSLALLALLAAQIWRSASTRENNDTAFALVCIGMLLLSPITWAHALILLALPLGLFLRDALAQQGQQEERKPLPVALFLLALFLVSLPDFDVAYYLWLPFAPERMPWYAALPMLSSTIGLGIFWWVTARRFEPDDKNYEPSEQKLRRFSD
jgi:hypothetical protein